MRVGEGVYLITISYALLTNVPLRNITRAKEATGIRTARDGGVAISNAMLSGAAGSPLVNISIIIGKITGTNAVASVSNGFALGLPCTRTPLIFSCLNCRPRRVIPNTGGRLAILLRRSAGTLRRIIIMNCAGRHGRAVVNSITAVAAGSLARDPATGVGGTLTKHLPNLVMGRCTNNRPNISRDRLFVHNGTACNGRDTVIVISKVRHSVDCLTPSRVRAFAVLGSTSTATTCNVHNTGNMVIVAAGHNGTTRGTAIGLGTSVNVGRPVNFPRCLNSTSCTALCGRTELGSTGVANTSVDDLGLFSRRTVSGFHHTGKSGSSNLKCS